MELRITLESFGTEHKREILKALEDIDNIIELIKKSESAAAAKVKLSEKYGFTSNQAHAIVEMKLGKLAGLEKIEISSGRA